MNTDPAIAEYPVTPEPDDYAPSGIQIDGSVYSLAGQPVIAKSHGWGNMAWFFWPKH
jgi:hypothetical protein